jgi:hypothetical protein
MPLITISGTPIEFPDTAQSPDWSAAVILFAQTVADSINAVKGPYDISTQPFVIDTYPNNSNVILTNLAFSPSAVRAAYIRYSVYRIDSLNAPVAESGQIIIVYNSSNPVNNKWEIVQERVGDAKISFKVEDNGQFYFSTAALGGTLASHQGKITFGATALSQ